MSNREPKLSAPKLVGYMDLLKGRNSKAEMNGIPDPVFIKQTYMVSDKGTWMISGKVSHGGYNIYNSLKPTVVQKLTPTYTSNFGGWFLLS